MLTHGLILYSVDYDNELVFEYRPTEDMIADILTKPLVVQEARLRILQSMVLFNADGNKEMQ